MVCPASHRVPRVPWYSGSPIGVLSLSLTGLSPSLADLSSVILLARGFLSPLMRCGTSIGAVYPHIATTAVFSTIWVWAPPLSLATTQGILSFPAGTKMFQFPAFPPSDYLFPLMVLNLQSSGFPHSGTPDSYVCTRLVEAFRSVPRPSSALDA